MNKQSTRYNFHPQLEFPIYEHDHKFNLVVPYKQKIRVNITLKQHQSIALELVILTFIIPFMSFIQMFNLDC
jgi:hypothetical protein